MTMRGWFVDLGRWPTRFFMERRLYAGCRPIYVVSELQSGRRVAKAATERDALETADTALWYHTYGSRVRLMRKVRRAIRQSGRANPWTKVCR